MVSKACTVIVNSWHTWFPVMTDQNLKKRKLFYMYKLSVSH